MASTAHEYFYLRASLSDRFNSVCRIPGSNGRLNARKLTKESRRCHFRAAFSNKGDLCLYTLHRGIMLQFVKETSSLQDTNYQSLLNTSQRLRRFGRRGHQIVEVGARLLDPVIFDAAKLTVDFMDAVSPADVADPQKLLPRHYTLTHHDVTAELQLTIGSSINEKQLSGWYTRLLRDEVVAEWRINEHQPELLSLHVHCHISGGQVFIAPAALRDWIFRREIPLVLKAFRHGDTALFEMHPGLEYATVWVHYHSASPQYNRADCWGPLRLAISRLNSPDNYCVNNKDHLQVVRPSMCQTKKPIGWIEDLEVVPDFNLEESLCPGHDKQDRTYEREVSGRTSGLFLVFSFLNSCDSF